MDAKKYDSEIEIVDLSEAQELIVKVIMQEGALRFQDQVIAVLKEKNLHEAIEVVKATELEL